MIRISEQLALGEEEISFAAIRSGGAGGQHVNKVSTAIHLRFDITASSLPVKIQRRLLDLQDRRVNADGIIVIKADRHRSQAKNREEALERLRQMILAVSVDRKRRIATRPGRAARMKRLENKKRRAQTKHNRKKITRLD